MLRDMRPDAYRSYVVRVRRRGGDGPGPDPVTRLDVEDLLGGGVASVSGEPASALAERLERLVDEGRPAAAPEGDGKPATD